MRHEPPIPHYVDRPRLNDVGIQRMTHRIGLFMRRGMSETVAEAWADRLATRDYERDDRSACIECAQLQQGGTCAVKVAKRKPESHQRYLQPVFGLLQRCHSFVEQTQ